MLRHIYALIKEGEGQGRIGSQGTDSGALPAGMALFSRYIFRFVDRYMRCPGPFWTEEPALRASANSPVRLLLPRMF